MQSPYFELAERFWTEDERHPISPIATKLYFKLLHEANRRYWRGPVVLSWTALQGLLDVSRDSVRRAINILTSRGLITYRKGSKQGQRSSFWFPMLEEQGGSKNELVQNSDQLENETGSKIELVQKLNQLEDQGGSKIELGWFKNQTDPKSTLKSTPKSTFKSTLKPTYINNTNTNTNKIQDSVYINNYTHSGVSKTEEEKEPPPEESTEPPEELPSYELPSDCVGIPCGRILELYAMHFKKPPMQKIRPAEAKVIRERYIENPSLDWNGFLEWVARHKSDQYTLYQLFMYKVFYQLLEEYNDYIEFEKKMDKIAKEVQREKSQVRTGKIIYIGDALKRAMPQGG